MYEPTVTAETEETDKNVTPIYQLYEGTVAEFKRPTYFTISPDPRNYDGYVKGHSLWMANIRHIMYNTCYNYIYVLELAGLRPHYHGVADVKDIVGFTKRMYNASRCDNVKTHNKFKDGIKYMFKSIDTTYQLTDIQPVRERQDDYIYKLDQQEQLKAKRLKEKQDNLSISLIDYPLWMIDEEKAE